MSVSQLYLICEGQEHGEDTLVLAKILTGVATVTPEGSKQDLPHRYFWHRKQGSPSRIAVLRDRDFDHQPDQTTLLDRPLTLTANQKGSGTPFQIGWTWERVSIENYLIDPIVLEKIFGEKFPAAAYRDALAKAVSGLRTYTAARIALSHTRIPRGALANKWAQHYAATPDDCRAKIEQLVREYSQQHTLDAPAAIARFDALIPTCEPGGDRGALPLVYFSGEDLLAAMQPSLGKLKLEKGNALIEEVATRINESQDDVWTWLPEWQALRRIVEQKLDF